MPKITYISHDGERNEVDVPKGLSVMRGAVSNGIPGIDADCGGACACGTCHVYVDPEWLPKLKPMVSPESETIELVSDRRDNSRLSCQIEVTDALDGLVVTTPAAQG